MQALIQNGAVAQFPYSLAQMKQDNPNVGFPRNVSLPFEGPNGTLVEVVQADMPTLAAGQKAVPDTSPSLANGEWVLGWTVQAMTSEEAQAAATAAREALHADLAQYRWQVETGGLDLPSGARIATGEESARKLTSAITSLDKGFVTSPLDFKFETGFASVTKAEIEAVASLVAQHTQSCFSAEKAVSQQIDALGDAELAGFDPRAAFDAELSGSAP